MAKHGSAPSEQCRGSCVVESDAKVKEVAALVEQRALCGGFEMHVFSSHQKASADNAAPLPILSLGAVGDKAGLLDGWGDGNPRVDFSSPVPCWTYCSMRWQAVLQLASSSLVFSVNEKVFLIAV